MKVAILGSGATGSAFAAYMKLGGIDDIWLIDLNRAHMDAVRDHGLIFKDHNGERVVTGFHTAYTAEEVGLCDILIVLVKSTHTRSAMQGAMCCIGENTVVISLQNGLGNDLALSEFVPMGRIGCGCGRMGTELPGPGRCVAKPSLGISNMFLGPIERTDLSAAACKYIVDAFAKGGLAPEYHDDIRPYIWKKAAANSGFNTVCAVLGLTMKKVYEDEHGFGLVKAILKEASDVAAAMGVAPNLYDGLIADVPTTVKSYGDYYPSLAQDLLIYKRPTEVDTLSCAISTYGKMANVPTPVCDVLSEVVRSIQGNYESIYKDQ